MSLVAYGSSDDSSEDEEETVAIQNDEEIKQTSTNTDECSASLKLAPQCNIPSSNRKTSDCLSENINIEASESLLFNKLPQPKNMVTAYEDIIEEDDDIPPRKEIETFIEKPVKKERAPVKISVPSLSEFKDVDEENEHKRNIAMPSKKGTGLFAILPPPKGNIEVSVSKPLVPRVLSKVMEKPKLTKIKTLKHTAQKHSVDKSVENNLGISEYDSNSEDEDGPLSSTSKSSTVDFFSLTSTDNVPDDTLNEDLLAKSIKVGDYRAILTGASFGSALKSDMDIDNEEEYPFKQSDESTSVTGTSNRLVSNVINLPKEEIALKNKAEVGPKLPVPEQEYNIDQDGNVAFDDKAIEYLCGKRGVKRKEQVMDEANIIEISGEDIKPDEREWLVKALTEEPVQRPVSMLGGVNSQSKKKHQITYLAHQAKAMEMELKNQWAQNRMTRKQTQSKYGF